MPRNTLNQSEIVFSRYIISRQLHYREKMSQHSTELQSATSRVRQPPLTLPDGRVLTGAFASIEANGFLAFLASLLDFKYEA